MSQVSGKNRQKGTSCKIYLGKGVVFEEKDQLTKNSKTLWKKSLFFVVEKLYSVKECDAADIFSKEKLIFAFGY